MSTVFVVIIFRVSGVLFFELRRVSRSDDSTRGTCGHIRKHEWLMNFQSFSYETMDLKCSLFFFSLSNTTRYQVDCKFECPSFVALSRH